MSLHADFTALVRTYAGDLFRYAHWLCRDSHRAEDLVQETLLRSWRAFPKLRETGSAKAWLLTTLRRELFREGAPSQDLSLDDPELDFGAEAALQHIHEMDSVLDAERCLGRLPETYREVLMLQLHFGYSTLEIAAVLGITEPAVANRLLRARRALSALAEPQDGTVVPFRRRSL
ncbi:MAG: sigma-70 family RNA polymerase sigma factor [Gammaproteobacteria bacterium]|nr:sigma-70 family RNA polymerase sigma factor [Gammaproteobacteria bacterium]